MRPPGKSWESFQRSKRKIRQYKSKNTNAKLRDSAGKIDSKNVLRCSLLNVNGLSESSLACVETVVEAKKPDIVILLETKRRVEDSGIDVSVPGYTCFETKRSNIAGDREGGGIAIYTRLGVA